MRWVRMVLAALVACVAVIGGLMLAAMVAAVGLMLMLFGRVTGRARVTTPRGRRPSSGPAAAPEVRRSAPAEGVIDVVATEVPERR